jgi:hypothetical protein
MIIALIVIVIIAVMFLQGCNKKPVPTPNPDPEPDKPKWEDYYPIGHKIPYDFYNKWIKRIFDSGRWLDYENKIINFMVDEDRKDIFDELTLAKLLTHKENDKWFFTWTSDLEVFEKEDYWATPDEYVIDKNGLGDCDDFCGFHCDFLDRKSKYWLVWWVEVYWKRYVKTNLKNPDGSYVYKWKSLGHAITILKRSPESNWKCFSNNSFLGMSNGFETLEEIIYKFVPVNDVRFKDQYELTRVRARHPIEGTLLWEVKGEDMT